MAAPTRKREYGEYEFCAACWARLKSVWTRGSVTARGIDVEVSLRFLPAQAWGAPGDRHPMDSTHDKLPGHDVMANRSSKSKKAIPAKDSPRGGGGVVSQQEDAPDSALQLFHPTTAAWFRAVFDQPTAPRWCGVATVLECVVSVRERVDSWARRTSPVRVEVSWWSIRARRAR